MPRFIRYFQTGEELPQQPEPSFLEDESWIGTAPRTLLSAVAAVALAGQVTLGVVNQPEELPVAAPTTVVEESDFVLPLKAPQRSTPLAFISDEEIVLAWLSEDDVVTLQRPPQLTRPLAWSDPDEGASLVTLIDEDVNTPVVRPASVSRALQLFADEEFAPQAATSVLDDDAFTLPRSARSSRQLALAFDEEFVPPPATVLLDDGQFQLPAASSNRRNQLALFADEEISLAWLHDDEGAHLLQPRPRAVQLQLFADDELPAIALADEIFVLPPHRAAPTRAAPIFEEEFVVQTFALEEDAFWLPLVLHPNKPVLLSTAGWDDDAIATGAPVGDGRIYAALNVTELDAAARVSLIEAQARATEIVPAAAASEIEAAARVSPIEAAAQVTLIDSIVSVTSGTGS